MDRARADGSLFRPTYEPYTDSEGPLTTVWLHVAERTPGTVLVYFRGGASACIRTADFDARYKEALSDLSA